MFRRASSNGFEMLIIVRHFDGVDQEVPNGMRMSEEAQLSDPSAGVARRYPPFQVVGGALKVGISDCKSTLISKALQLLESGSGSVDLRFTAKPECGQQLSDRDMSFFQD